MEQNIKEIMEEFEKSIQKAWLESDEDEDVVKWVAPSNFSQFCKNLEGRKQYRYHDTYPSLHRGWLTIYFDGKEIYTFHFWSGELSFAIDALYDEGFCMGYTAAEVSEAKAIYTHKLHNKLGGYNEEN